MHGREWLKAVSLVPPEGSPHEIVDRDLTSIAGADGVLVNMWKESIGSAIGVVHARAKGKVVVLGRRQRERRAPRDARPAARDDGRRGHQARRAIQEVVAVEVEAEVEIVP